MIDHQKVQKILTEHTDGSVAFLEIQKIINKEIIIGKYINYMHYIHNGRLYSIIQNKKK